ncbi:MAG: uracil-DNA glycosylase, partial [Acidimicrobiia bacterium]|nr:uracil-DNA glycosylase [Acidimicrobiia bacterium]
MIVLDQVATDVAACGLCPRLVQWRERIASEKRAAFADQDYWGRGVPGFGDPEATVMIVGLAPAAHGANRTGRMFTGDRSGDWLYRALYRAGFSNQPDSVSINDGLTLNDAWVTSPVKCAPPLNKPTVEEIATCRPYFETELAELRPRVIVALGAIGFRSVVRHFDIRPRPTFGHGVELSVDSDSILLGSYHVSQQNTFTGKLTEPMLDAVFDRARMLAG